MTEKTSFIKRLVGFVPFLLVLLFSFGLLFYTGIGDAGRVYGKFYVNKAASFGEIVQNPVTTYLLLGFPLTHYAGFETSTGPLLKSEHSIERISIRDEAGAELFTVAQPDAPPKEDDASFSLSSLSSSLTQAGKANPPRVFESHMQYKISFPLANKIGIVGTLEVFASKSAADARILQTFLLPGIAAIALLVVFALLGVFVFRKAGRGSRIGIQLSFALAFLLLAGFIIGGLVSLYREGVGDKTEALARSLGGRLDSAVKMGIELEDLTGIDEIFSEYTRIDPDIESIRLMRGRETVIDVHSANQAAAGITLTTALLTLDIPLEAKEGGTAADLRIAVGIPLNRIYEQLLRSGKNFIVLLISCILLSVLFLNILFALRKKNEIADSGTLDAGQTEEIERGLKLELISPLYFLAVFVEGLFTSFLPQFFQKVAAQSNMGPEASSMLFTIYFAAFVIALLPTGKFAERGSIKWILNAGMLLCAASYVMLAALPQILFIVASRVIAGLGQGMLFIGIQSYILRTSSARKRTQGSSIIVFGFNAGFISGTALGSLLVAMLGDNGVFMVAGVTCGFVAVYTLFFVQKLPRIEKIVTARKKTSIGAFFRTWADLDFVRTVLFVGLITKAILTGINSFALPIILSAKDYLKEDIGQIVIFYSAASLVSTRFVAPVIDRFGKSRGFLFAGTQLGGIALYALGFIAADAFTTDPFIRTLLLIAGMVLLGIGHGFIHAPVVTHIASTRVARELGSSSVTSIYRTVERMGHVLGPLVVGPLMFSMGSGSALSLSWVGIAAAIAGCLFFIGKGSALPVIHTQKTEAPK